VVNEIQSTVTTFTYATGSLKEVQTVSILPQDFSGQQHRGNSTGSSQRQVSVCLEPGSRQHCRYSIDPKTGNAYSG
jgi:6-phosphogluconolactonase (cycloisomerase 2 family)